MFGSPIAKAAHKHGLRNPIVKQHNGYVVAYSEQSQGTTFKIYFPQTALSIEEEDDHLDKEPSIKGTDLASKVRESLDR